MTDTIREYEAQEKCSDCGKLGVHFTHCGELVPPGFRGKFCGLCWKARLDFFFRQGTPKPIGVSATS